MAEPPDDPELRLPWVQRPRLLTAFVLVCLVLVALAFVAGRFVRSASDLPGASTTAGPAYAPVVSRVVEKMPARDGTVVGHSLVSVPAPGTSDVAVERSVVTRTPIATGDTVRAGQLLAVVSGRPIFLLRLSVPLYRPLSDGDTGDDVREVQTSLAEIGLYRAGVDGSFGPATQAAVADLYERAGFEAPRKASTTQTDPAGDTNDAEPAESGKTVAASPATVRLPMGEVFGIPEGSAVVAEVTPRGTILTDPGAAVAKLRVGGLVVRARISVDERTAYAVGNKVRISAPELTATSWEGTVTAVSGFQQPAEGSAGAGGDDPAGTSAADSTSSDPKADLPGYDVTVRISGDPDELTADRRVTVIPITASAEPGPAVPLIAIRQDSAGTYVLTDDGRRVSVEVTSEADGWAALAEGPLTEGTRVQVSP